MKDGEEDEDKSAEERRIGKEKRGRMRIVEDDEKN